MMEVQFVFTIGQAVTHSLTKTPGRVVHANIDRNGTIGYYVEYATFQGEIKEVYASESDLTAV